MLLRRQSIINACDRALSYVDKKRSAAMDDLITQFAANDKQPFWSKVFRRKWVPLGREELREFVINYDPRYKIMIDQTKDLYETATALKVAAELAEHEFMDVDLKDLYQFHVTL